VSGLCTMRQPSCVLIVYPRTLASVQPSLVEVTHVADWARLTYSMYNSMAGTRLLQPRNRISSLQEYIMIVTASASSMTCNDQR
jgi:hypothetical protein